VVGVCFFFQAEDGIRDDLVTGVQTCALPIWLSIEGAPIAASIVRFLSGNWTSIEFRFTLCPMKESMSTAAPEKSTEACRCPRPYRLGKRQEAMDQKRLQMLHAARQLLLERGFPSFTIEAVA